VADQDRAIAHRGQLLLDPPDPSAVQGVGRRRGHVRRPHGVAAERILEVGDQAALPSDSSLSLAPWTKRTCR
jgi:hypothetical protein